MRVGVRNRAGEAIGKPVANLRGRWTSANILAEKRLKRPALRFSANRSADRFSSILAADHRERKRKINGKSNYSLGERKSIGKPANAKATARTKKNATTRPSSIQFETETIIEDRGSETRSLISLEDLDADRFVSSPIPPGQQRLSKA